jgi:starvation-inducible outer membrane lipoprotein
LLSLSFYVHRIVFLATVFLAGGCAWTNTVPAKFVRQAEPGVTLTSLAGRPEVYKGKVVILGGVIAEEKRADGRVWLWVKNRPLDADYEPHRDASRTPSESGHYWVVVDLRGLPQGYRSWARLTVVGQVLYRAGPAIRCAVH